MHQYEERLLGFLAKKGAATLDEITDATELGRDTILWAAESLQKAGAIDVKRAGIVDVKASQEGERYMEEFPEESLVRKLATRKERVGDVSDHIALGWAKKNGWITIDSGGILGLTKEGGKAASGSFDYPARKVLISLTTTEPGRRQDLINKNKDVVAALVKRGLIEVKERNEIRSLSITKKGADMLAKAPKEQGIGLLAKDLIKSGEWSKLGFRPYDVSAPSDTVYPSRMHPVREFINVMRRKWLEMGFIEVEGPIIETAFWNFDALFSPQDHPTRDMQDTFFLSNPDKLTIEDITALHKVKEMHLTGWKETWNEELARSAILRTHTTSVSARQMRKLAKAMQQNYPIRMFSIGSVFRNENLDYKHLAELRQYDGIIVGNDLTLANLIYVLKTFYSKLGIDDVKVRPSYFPFVEPGLEFYYFDKEHNDSIELCGGGVIREEITKALGLSRTVLAWGGGVDRLMLNQKIFGVESLPTLFKNDVSWLRSRGNLKV